MDVGKLSLDVFLPAPILEMWKETFLGGGRDALTDAGLAVIRASRGDADAPPPRPDRTPAAKRYEIVLRLLAREDENALSQSTLVPVPVLNEWREAFLAGAGSAVRAKAEAEFAENPDAVRARYEAIVVRAGSADRDRLDLLDSLDDLLGSGGG
jgi:hypothetical protein